MNQMVEPLVFTVPLSFEAHAIARQYQQQQPAARAKHSYLKALCVYAVEFYLRCLGIAVAAGGDWRDPFLSRFLDLADLSLQQTGILECCYVLPGGRRLQISPDAWADRIGYIAVQFTESLQSATLLGFVSVPEVELPLERLRSLAEFPTYLAEVRQLQATAAVELESGQKVRTGLSMAQAAQRVAVNLRNWVEGSVETGWQAMEELLGAERVEAIAVRSGRQFAVTVRRAKLIDTGIDLDGHAVVLSLAVTVNPDTSMNVLVQLHSGPNTLHLPAHLKLTMMTEAGEVLQEVVAREHDNYIQLKRFRGEAGDNFDIQVSLQEASVVESFVL